MLLLLGCELPVDPRGLTGLSPEPDADLMAADPAYSECGVIRGGVTLVQEGPLRYAGRVVDEQGAPVAGVDIGAQLHGASIPVPVAVSDEAGRWEVELPHSAMVAPLGRRADSLGMCAAHGSLDMDFVVSPTATLALRLTGDTAGVEVMMLSRRGVPLPGTRQVPDAQGRVWIQGDSLEPVVFRDGLPLAAASAEESLAWLKDERHVMHIAVPPVERHVAVTVLTQAGELPARQRLSVLYMDRGFFLEVLTDERGVALVPDLGMPVKIDLKSAFLSSPGYLGLLQEETQLIAEAGVVSMVVCETADCADPWSGLRCSGPAVPWSRCSLVSENPRSLSGSGPALAHWCTCPTGTAPQFDGELVELTGSVGWGLPVGLVPE